VTTQWLALHYAPAWRFHIDFILFNCYFLFLW
jgi:hypothetical protein